MMDVFNKLLSPQWAEAFGFNYLSGRYFNQLGNFINKEYKENVCYPPKEDIFKIFRKISPQDARIVILGQDPYHEENQATGVAFAVPETQLVIPPSLMIIEAEVKDDIYKLDNTLHFDYTLERWTSQGVFLLNTALTVRKGEAGSHALAWSSFTEAVISILNTYPGKIFLLWGKYARAYAHLINPNLHYTLTAAHPVSEVYKRGSGFLDCKHFSKVNEILEKNNGIEFIIKW